MHSKSKRLCAADDNCTEKYIYILRNLNDLNYYGVYKDFLINLYNIFVILS